MPLADSNVWLALALSKHEFHLAARRWMSQLSAQQPALFCRLTQLSLLRLLTTAAVSAPYGIPALTNKAAWSIYEGFRADGRIAWVEEPRTLESSWKKLASASKASPKLWMDAYLASFALSGNYQLVTTDGAFKQFKGLDVLVLPKG
ncbi:MAG: TA system VapC family ribonuclease toxin [Gemmataceae bacterium]